MLLVGTQSNRSAIGAASPCYGGKRQAQEVTGQSSFYSVNDRRLHFGLGDAADATVEVRWPGGKTEQFRDVPADHLVVIREGEGIVRSERWSKR